MRRRPRPGIARPALNLSVSAVALVALVACAPTAGDPATPTPSPTVEARADIEGLVDIGGDRELFATCRGEGSPSVVLVSGTGGAADEWMVTLSPDDPSAPPAVSAASVFDQLSQVTRVCAYDRPGTTDAAGAVSPSTLVPQPTSAFDGVADLEALLDAMGETGPYVVVGASWGGLIAQLFARTHTDEVSGVVLVDSASMFLHEYFTPEQWASWMAVIAAAETGHGAERPDYEAARERWPTEPPPLVPTVVLSSDREWDLSVTPGISTWPAWLLAQDALAESLGAHHIGDTGSGHGIHVEQPQLVVDAIESVVDEVRAQQRAAPTG